MPMIDRAKVSTAAVAIIASAVLAMTLFTPGSAWAYTQKEQIVNSGHGSANPSYLVIHETANPGASAANHVKLYSRGYDYAVQYVMELDGSVVYHTMRDNRKAWAVGSGNSKCVNIELAHATSKSDFDKQWAEAVKWAGDYLNKRGWSISSLISHNEARLMWGGTDHTDPVSYFNKYGKSWSQFEQAVSVYMSTGKVQGGYSSGSTSKPASKPSSGTSKESFAGTYTVMVNDLQIRSAPDTSASSVGSYKKGSKVKLDGWYKINDGYVWGKYTAYSGKTRYVAVGKPTGGVSARDYLIKGGKATASNSGGTVKNGAGTYRFATDVNIRSGMGSKYSDVGDYRKGQTVKISKVTVKDGYRWGQYTAYSGKTRYVALGTRYGKAYAIKIA